VVGQTVFCQIIGFSRLHVLLRQFLQGRVPYSSTAAGTVRDALPRAMRK